jgi:uncharacterized protein YuzE
MRHDWMMGGCRRLCTFLMAVLHMRERQQQQPMGMEEWMTVLRMLGRMPLQAMGMGMEVWQAVQHLRMLGRMQLQAMGMGMEVWQAVQHLRMLGRMHTSITHMDGRKKKLWTLKRWVTLLVTICAIMSDTKVHHLHWCAV